ncbi:MAG: hypothetical protein ACLU4B_05910 [Bilophila wadsworthia]
MRSSRCSARVPHDLVLCMGIVASSRRSSSTHRLAVALMPVVHTYCSTNGVVQPPVILITIACCLAFLTPAASPQPPCCTATTDQHQKHLEIAPFLIVLAHRCERGIILIGRFL